MCHWGPHALKELLQRVAQTLRRLGGRESSGRCPGLPWGSFCPSQRRAARCSPSVRSAAWPSAGSLSFQRAEFARPPQS